MKTLDFDMEMDRPNFERPSMNRVGRNMVYEGIVVLKIEEFNMFDELLGKTQRAYRIYWKNKEGKIKFFDCGLNTDTYKRFVVPNAGKIEIMRP